MPHRWHDRRGGGLGRRRRYYLSLDLEPRLSLTVGVANGDHVPSADICKQVLVTIGEERFVIELYILPLTTMSWSLAASGSLSSILWDFERRILAW